MTSKCHHKINSSEQKAEETTKEVPLSIVPKPSHMAPQENRANVNLNSDTCK
jgi:hypothetical protein